MPITDYGGTKCRVCMMIAVKFGANHGLRIDIILSNVTSSIMFAIDSSVPRTHILGSTAMSNFGRQKKITRTFKRKKRIPFRPENQPTNSTIP